MFISEYIEGSSYNKALEIYNGTGATVDLSAYTIAQSNTATEIALSGQLAHGEVFVLAHASAAPAILSVADQTTGSIVYNGDDVVTLKKNGSSVDVVGVEGTVFGENQTLVRKESVTSGRTAYQANEWHVYPQNTYTYLGSHTVNPPASAIWTESFENGAKGAYADGNVSLDSGSWAFHNALIGNLATDRKNGSQAVRIRATGTLGMNFDVNGAGSVRLQVANFGNDSSAAWQLQKSTNGGASWTHVTSAAAATSTLTAHTITVNESSPVRFRIHVTGPSGQRLNVDDFEILN
nr:lamin tail domain-containing protein [Xylanibacillus composti]